MFLRISERAQPRKKHSDSWELYPRRPRIERYATLGSAPHTVSPPFGIQNLAWFRNGKKDKTVSYCLDNIRRGVSAIPQAGYGAFATRSISSGHVVAPLPLVHFSIQDMEIWNTNGDIRTYHHLPDVQLYVHEGYQLLLNYCFGHKQSSMLFFPYSPTVNYINHAAGPTANVMLRWASSNYTNNLHRDEWFHREPASLQQNETQSGLILELVATRDIAPDEEILLDYGPEWEQAWQHYASVAFPSIHRDPNYVSANTYNQRLMWLYTLDEMQEMPQWAMTNAEEFPNWENVQLWCWTDDVSSEAVGSIEVLESVNNVDDGTGPSIELVTRDVFEFRNSKKLFLDYPCDIVDRHYNTTEFSTLDAFRQQYELAAAAAGSDPSQLAPSMFPDVTYTVKMYGQDDVSYVSGVPRYAIRFFDRKYGSDSSLRDSFRHSIMLPDHLVPTAWRDLQQ
jgi:SET domain